MTRRSAPTIRMPDGLFDLLDETEPEPEIASTPDAAPINWPRFETVDGLSGRAKAQAATDLIAFIEAGFPKDVWESGQLRFLLQGAFTPQYEITAQKLWEDAFSSGPRQALWLEQLIPERHRENQRSGRNKWCDFEAAVLDEIRERGLAARIRDAERTMWSAPQVKGSRRATVAPQFAFESTIYTPSKVKAKFATDLVKLIESNFERRLFTHSVYDGLYLHCFGHIAHYDIHGFYAEQFDSTARQLRWFVDAWKYVNAMNHRTSPERGDTHSWRDVESALIATIDERDYVRTWAHRHNAEVEVSERQQLQALLARYPDARPPEPVAADGGIQL